MKDRNRYKGSRINDYIIDCDICGAPCWHSETRILDTYTGQGGAIVCPRHKDPIDYGLVPYTIPAEKPVPEARILQPFNANQNIVGDPPFDPGPNDPMQDFGLPWQRISAVTWDQFFTAWGANV